MWVQVATTSSPNFMGRRLYLQKVYTDRVDRNIISFFSDEDYLS